MSEGMSLGQINRPTINMDNTGVANNPNDKASGEEYFDRRNPQNENKEDFNQSPFVDRSAQLRATLNSLAALNAVNVVKVKDKYKDKQETKKLDIDDNSAKVSAILEKQEQEQEKENQENP